MGEEDERLPFSFTGQISTPMSLDPREFKGMSAEAVEAQIRDMLSGMGAGAAYFDDEIQLAAEVIVGANGEG